MSPRENVAVGGGKNVEHECLSYFYRKPRFIQCLGWRRSTFTVIYLKQTDSNRSSVVFTDV